MSSPTQLSQLELLIEPVFIPMCAYLKLDEKCSRLPMLSRTLKSAFNPARCCNDYVRLSVFDKNSAHLAQTVVDVSQTSIFIWPYSSVVPYAQYAKGIRCTIWVRTHPPNRRKNILLSMRKALVDGHLQILHMTEGCIMMPATQPAITCELLLSLNKPKVQLRELYIIISDLRSEREAGFFGALKHCKTLLQLHVEMLNDDIDDQIIASLPNSLQDLIVSTASSKNDRWNQALQQNDFLPMLRRFALREVTTPYAPSAQLPMLYFVDSLSNTIMIQTGQLRPINSWMTLTLQDLVLVNKFPITEISCSSVHDVTTELSGHPEDMLISLDSISLYLQDESPDPSALVIFAAHRPIRHFTFDSQTKLPHGSLSDDMVSALSQMHMLRFLHLGSSDIALCRSDDLTDLIPANCWPNLDVMTLRVTEITEEQLLIFLKAAPSCRSIHVQTELPSISSTLVLAMILFVCPNIVRIQIYPSEQQTSVESLDHMQDAFRRYPIQPSSCQKLVDLQLSELRCSAPALHYLVHQFTYAPRIEIISFGPIALSALNLCIARSFVHVHCIYPMSKFQSIPELKNPKMASLISYRPTGGAYVKSFFEDLFYFDKKLYNYNMTRDEILVAMYGADRPYPVIKPLFFETLYEVLTAKDQARLTSWDAGDYTVK